MNPTLPTGPNSEPSPAQRAGACGPSATSAPGPDLLFSDAAAALLADHCPAAVVRAVEAGGSALPLWQAIDAAGFADALVPEAAGGAGLALAQVFGVWLLCGRHALPLPLPETMLARALLARAGAGWGRGPIALGQGRALADGRWRCAEVAHATTAAQVLVLPASGGTVGASNPAAGARLLPVAAAQAEPSASLPLHAALTWPADAWAQAQPLALAADARSLQALVAAVLLAGTALAVLDLSLAQAAGRQQFGRPIGQFQAIQHQLSVMAEEVHAARMAAQIGCQADDDGRPDPLRVAVAKARCSEAAVPVAALAHAVHGAIGFTREADLQLLTRRLHAGRLMAGSESHWHDRLGAALLGSDPAGTLDLLRAATDPPGRPAPAERGRA